MAVQHAPDIDVFSRVARPPTGAASGAGLHHGDPEARRRAGIVAAGVHLTNANLVRLSLLIAAEFANHQIGSQSGYLLAEATGVVTSARGCRVE